MTDTDPSSSSEPGGGEGSVADPGTLWDRATDSFLRWQGGEARAMDELVRLMTPVLWHVVRSYGLDRMLAEDVVQTTWHTLLRRHESIHDARAVTGWLTTCARREAWRAGRVHRRTRLSEPTDLEPLLPAADPADVRGEVADRDRRLWTAVAALDERCRRLIQIVAFEQRPDYTGIAEQLRMPIGSIGPTRGRCLAKLRTALHAEGWRGDTHDL